MHKKSIELEDEKRDGNQEMTPEQKIFSEMAKFRSQPATAEDRLGYMSEEQLVWRVETFAEETKELESTFKKRFVEKWGPVAETTGDERQSEFEVWEKRFTTTWNSMEEAARELGLDFGEKTEMEQAVITTNDEKQLRNTIEAQAGNYYQQRMSVLRQAIKDSNTHNADEDIAICDKFFSVVSKHLALKMISTDDFRFHFPNGEGYDEERTRIHNKVIETLNTLNDLAKQYGCLPFTARNFLPSNKISKDEQLKHPSIAARMRYDRDIVEEYYALAFNDELERKKRVQAVKARLFR